MFLWPWKCEFKLFILTLNSTRLGWVESGQNYDKIPLLIHTQYWWYGPRNHISIALRNLHWLPIQQRIKYKLCLLMHLVHNNQAPLYLADSVTTTVDLSHHTLLQSASSLRYKQPRTWLKFGDRCFAFAGPAASYSLPSSVQEPS